MIYRSWWQADLQISYSERFKLSYYQLNLFSSTNAILQFRGVQT